MGKLARQKRVERLLKFYKLNFGFRPPYQVLIDGTFCVEALKSKFNIREQLMAYFDEQVRFFTTPCAIIEIDSLGRELYGPASILKQFPPLKCGHEKNPISASKCFQSMVSTNTNERHYMLATQDPNLQKWTKSQVGVPLLFISWRAIMLDDPSKVTQKAVNEKINITQTDADPQLEKVRLLKAKEGLNKRPFKKIKKKPKGPNPLSCKKPKPKPHPNQSSAGSTEGKKKRKRKPKSAAQGSASTSNQSTLT